MNKYNISANVIWVIKHLNEKANCAVLFNSSMFSLLVGTLSPVDHKGLCQG